MYQLILSGIVYKIAVSEIYGPFYSIHKCDQIVSFITIVHYLITLLKNLGNNFFNSLFHLLEVTNKIF